MPTNEGAGAHNVYKAALLGWSGSAVFGAQVWVGVDVGALRWVSGCGLGLVEVCCCGGASAH